MFNKIYFMFETNDFMGNTRASWKGKMAVDLDININSEAE